MSSTLSSIKHAGADKRWGKDGAAIAPAASRAVAGGGRPALASAQPSASAAAGWRYSTQLNEQLTAAQCAQGFVDDMLRQLEDFKGNLSLQLTQRRVDDDGLAAQRDQLQQSWSQRQDDSAGSLDGQLRLSLGAPSRQLFSARGLDLDNLGQGQPETLVFSSGGGPAGAVRVGDGVGREEVLRRLNQALGPAGVRCELDNHGRLGFSCSEADWSRLRDSLAVRGGGVRFPGGVPQPLALDAEPPALAPAQWQVGDHAQVRQTLQGVLRAIAQLQQTRATIGNAIAEARQSISQLARQDEPSWADGFVSDFNARLNQGGDFGQLQQLLPALMGISRYRVLSLLSLR
ncbi:hypothetical protein KIF53_06950 [Chromobacterium subtsugae]|uniref:Flagellin N-terminal domain-containing protein n=2 Tax=Chromobacterium subtsugae TaxID=251747 RepID=A0ABS7FD36_9NEIS|nr:MULTISPECIES: hypothetical protein [Chromobacterium]KZE84551.1 hypothetical protein AWB61_03910 [Chromobacterium sp. F49]MBW7566244.1 hypothetical protein [Chromobacterium subtsugae]MBW8287365.1 hypothetical protein [Chromobacterium subtsugae]WSE90443.1 hypothetical protein U6115_16305 [Chromobacterium subtsugae]WVH58815.1 hypothetical protein U6151_16330 [Chromobacterium subtsugae]